MDEPFSAEAGSLDGADGPVERDGDSVFEFFVGFFDYVGGEEVEAAVDVFFAVFVEEAPCAALEVLC